jgi:hypothetical protein
MKAYADFTKEIADSKNLVGGNRLQGQRPQQRSACVMVRRCSLTDRLAVE